LIREKKVSHKVRQFLLCVISDLRMRPFWPNSHQGELIRAYSANEALGPYFVEEIAAEGQSIGDGTGRSTT
jgi:hypothetical protein